MGLFSFFPTENYYGYGAVRLAVSHLEIKSGQDMDEHTGFIELGLSVYYKKMQNVVPLFAKNRTSNQFILQKIALLLVGCASHRYQLAVRQVKSDDEDGTGAV